MATRYSWDDFVLDLDAYRLERGGAPLTLEPKAFNVLALLVARPGHVFSKQEIFDAVWPGTAVTDHALTRVIAQIRRVLGDEAREATYLETVPTRGYRWIRPVRREEVVGAEAAPTPMPEPAIKYAPELPPCSPRPTRRWTMAGVAVVAAIAVAVAVLLVFRRDAAPPALPALDSLSRPVQVTTHAGLDFQPALSPLGDAVAFSSDRTGAFEIYVRALGADGRETALTSDGMHNVEPAWSPDGQWLAFHSYGRGGIWVMPARGGVPRQVATSGSKPAWSPDSRRLAFQSDEHADVSPNGFGANNGSTIWIVDVNGAEPQQVTLPASPPGGHSLPAWSPDGRSLVFTVFDGGWSDGVWIVDFDTRVPRVIAQGEAFYDASYTPDGSAVLVAGNDAVLYRIPIAGGDAGRRQMVSIPGVPSARGLTMSANGRRLAFAAVTLSSQVWAQRIDARGVPHASAYALTADTSRRNTVPVVSPDGTRVVYMSARSGEEPNVWVMGIDGRDQVQLTSNDTFDAQPVWYPDGRRVAFVSNRGDVPALWSVDVTTRRQERVIDVTRLRSLAPASWAQARVAELRLSPSLRHAAFSILRKEDGHRALFVASLDTLEPRAITDGRESIGYPAWSPDEQRLAVEVKDGSSTHVGVVGITTGAVRRLTNERGQSWVRSWSPDGRKIAFAAFRMGQWSLRAVDVESGVVATIAPPEPVRVYVRYPEWSPRGDMIVFERAEMRGNVWTVDLTP